jgi:hypothetical protein
VSNENDVALEKYSVLFFLVFLVCICFSLAATYYRYVIIEDYEVFVEFNENGDILLIE